MAALMAGLWTPPLVDQGSVRARISDGKAAEMTFQVTALVLVVRPHDCRNMTWRVIDEVALTGSVS
jgi:hypothetical protein